MSRTSSADEPRKRVRTGCLTCRGRHRKCDEAKPVCENCRSKRLQCHWSVKGLFSQSNSQHVSPAAHYSVVPKLYNSDIIIVNEESSFVNKERRPKRRKSEYDYTNETETAQSLLSLNATSVTSTSVTPSGRMSVEALMTSPSLSASDMNQAPMITNSRQNIETIISTTTRSPIDAVAHTGRRRNSGAQSPYLERATLRTILNTSNTSGCPPAQSSANNTNTIVVSQPRQQLVDILRTDISQLVMSAPPPADIGIASNNGSNVSQREALSMARIAASEIILPHTQAGVVSNLQSPDSLPDSVQSYRSVTISPTNIDIVSDSGYAEENSTYHDLHNALLDYMFSSAKWMAPSRAPSPVGSTTNGNCCTRNERALANIDKARLLRNYVDEVASWLDMFDNQRHFAIVLPRLALQSHALFYSLLSISSRQMERIDYQYPSAVTLELYQQSIQHLLPSVQSKNIETIAACVVLCCLEMMSSSPQNWRRHLEGCAALFASARINGFCGGLGQSLFWCFARMDLSSAVIGEEPTIIKMQDWTPPGMSLNAAGELFRVQPSYDMYANYAVFLCSCVTNLIASDSPTTGSSFDAEWEMLWNELRIWVEQRPVELKPLLSFDEENNAPFPTILYGNGPAISGNQLYHTACILLMQNKPRSFKFPKSKQSMLWHAKQICAISLNNTHHGCWNNALQPLWVAGRLMSHHTEHTAILKILEEIEKSTGWAMKWRGEDLKEFWGMG
ncbi:fungal-specific transcription factor domain-containing protein [Lipomyces starkeyi]